MKKRIIQNLSRLSKETLQSKTQIQSKYNDLVKEASKRLADKDNFLKRQNLKIPSINQSLKILQSLKNNLDLSQANQSLQKIKNRLKQSSSQAAKKLTKSYNQNIKPKVNETKDSIKKTQQKVAKQGQEKMDDVKEAFGQKVSEFKSKQKETSKALDEKFSQVKNRLFDSTKQWAKISKDKSKSLFRKSQEKVVEQSRSKIKDIKKTLKDKFSLTKKKEKQPQNVFDSNLSFLKNSLSNSSNYLAKKSSQLPKQLGQSSLKAVKSLKESVDVNKKIKGTIDYLFWRIAILIGIVCFSYGIGSALPKEIRKLLKQTMMMKNDENSQNGDKKSSPQG